MAVTFINLTEKSFFKDYDRLYKFTNINRFLESLKTDEFGFVNPLLWPDPFEKFYLDSLFLFKGKKCELPAKNKVYALCVTRTLNSEAHWKVYAPKEDGIRININSKKLINILSKLPDVEVYIGKVEYILTSEFDEDLSDNKNLIQEINNREIGIEQIKLLYKKRKSFEYENEIRIIIVPRTNNTQNKVYKLEKGVVNFATGYTLDPRLGEYHAQMLKDYLKRYYSLSISQSTLYSKVNNDPILLS